MQENEADRLITNQQDTLHGEQNSEYRERDICCDLQFSYWITFVQKLIFLQINNTFLKRLNFSNSKCKKQGESKLIFAHLICAAISCYLFLVTFREIEAQSTLSSSFQKSGKSTTCSSGFLLLVSFYLLFHTLGGDT